MEEEIICKNCGRKIKVNSGNGRSGWQQCLHCLVAYFKIYRGKKRQIKKISWRILNNHK